MSVPGARGGFASPWRSEPADGRPTFLWCGKREDAPGKATFYCEGWTWEWDGTQEKIWEGAPVMFKVGADFQPFPSPPRPPAPSLQDATGELCCPIKASHEELMRRMFSCCFPDRLLGADSSSENEAELVARNRRMNRLNFWGRKQT